MKSFVRALVVLLLLGAAAVAVVSWWGIYPIGATTAHPLPLYHFLHYTMRRSVAHHSKGIQVPELSSPQRLKNGLVLYQEHCLQCHGAPGVAPDALARGMTPEPPNLLPAAREWAPADLYWVIRHGIKMTAMPSWQDRLDDAQMWDLVAFVREMTRLSPQQYKAMAGTPPAQPEPGPPWSTGGRLGDVATGRRKAEQYLCATCHAIPGIAGATENVGPPLDRIGQRQYIGGVLRNTPENMVRWLHDPPAIDPLTAMPKLGLREQDARDIAAYLYSLNGGH